MADFLLELFSEEIPARMQAAAAGQLQQRFEALLGESGLTAAAIEVCSTPRRLALVARGLPAGSQAVAEERRGPRADAPQAAIDGFLKSTGLTRDQLHERDTGKGVFLFADLATEGRPTAEILSARLPAMIAGFQWPKSQRWGRASVSTSSPRWVRPLRRIVALLDHAVVPFEALGLAAGRETFGHRFMGGRDPISIDSPQSYAAQLHAAFVVLSAGERQALVRTGAEAAAHKAGLNLRADAALEAENAGLAEWPVPLLGRFDPVFLQVPPEIIQLTMATNQKYFAVEDEAGKLAPAFVCVANLLAPDGGRAIVAGNERVLSARLADARFFWEQDRAKPLQGFGEKLGDIVFHEKLGTMAAKVDRVARLARLLAERHFPATDPAIVERAARLAKADLTTGTVGEFPELQGVIGGYLADVQGEDQAVVSALKQHYAASPQGDVAVAVALADRLDTLVSFFGAGIRPTGSKDPFALRRAALGILDMIVSGGRRIALRPVLQAAGAADPSELIAFLADRLKVQQREAGVRHDLVDAVFALGDEDDMVRLLARVRALQAFVETEDGRNLIAGYRRAVNILRAEEKKDAKTYSPDLAALQAGSLDKAELDEAEQDLARLFVPAPASTGAGLSAEAGPLLQREDFAGAMKLLATLRAPVDRFFDDVTVNADVADVRARRLGLLAGIREVMHRVADFSKIEG